MMSKKAYLVTAGSYSDYQVLAVFSSRDMADVFASEIGRRENVDVEEFLLDAPRTEWSGFDVSMLKDGTTTYIRRFMLRGFVSDTSIVKQSSVPFDGTREALCHTVFTDSQDLAVKVTNELRSRLIAENRWVVGEVTI